ncbi:MAG: hypothetical protein QM802_22560 [Agriterribacter sp.]
MILKKIIVIFVMLVHVNGSMLMPQVAETDIYDKNGRQIDDINSVVEYIDEVVMGNKGDTPLDEDNDDGQNLHIVKTFDYDFDISFLIIKKKPTSTSSKKQFFYFAENKISAPLLDIIAPPPKA